MKTISTLMLAALAVLSASASAEHANSTVSTVYEAQAVAPPKLQPTYATAPRAEIRELSLSEAKDLLASTEGAAWKVFGVLAPGCEASELKTARKKVQAPALDPDCEDQVEAKPKYITYTVPKNKECRAKQTECKGADKFASKFGLHATCSALYTRTSVLLSTDSTLQPPLKGSD